jgi:hypothetical protein
MNYNCICSSSRAGSCQDRIATTLPDAIGSLAPLHRRQVDGELRTAARGIGLVTSAGAGTCRGEGAAAQTYQDRSVTQRSMTSWKHCIQVPQQHFDRNRLIRGIESPAVSGPFVGVGNRAVKVSHSSPIDEGLRAGGVRRGPEEELISPIGKAEGVFVSRT